MKLTRNVESKVGYQVSPLIDIVFLLIIYFMVTASLVKKEADMSFALPQKPGPIFDLPLEVAIEIVADGTVEVEGVRFASADRALNELTRQITGLKQVAASQRSEFYVTIVPHREALHGRIIDVMDACSAAGVKKLGFGRSI